MSNLIRFQAPTIFLSLPEKPATIRLAPDLLARTQDEAKRRGWSFNRFGAWILAQFIEMEFLDAENRAFVYELVAQLQGPWTALDVVNALVTAARKEITAGKIRPMFWSGQILKTKKSDADLIEVQE